MKSIKKKIQTEFNYNDPCNNKFCIDENCKTKYNITFRTMSHAHYDLITWEFKGLLTNITEDLENKQ